MALESRVFTGDDGREWRAAVNITGWVEFYCLDDPNQPVREAKLRVGRKRISSINDLSEVDLRQLWLAAGARTP